MYHLINPVPRCIFHSHMSPAKNIKIVYKTEAWCSLTEIRAFENGHKNDICFLTNIYLFIFLTNYLQFLNIQAYDQKEKEPKTTYRDSDGE